MFREEQVFHLTTAYGGASPQGEAFPPLQFGIEDF